MTVLPDALIADFRRDGAVCVRGAFSPREVALVEAGIERNLADPSPRGIVASRSEDAGRFFEDFCNWGRIPEYEQVIRTSAAAGMRAARGPSGLRRVVHDTLLHELGHLFGMSEDDLDRYTIGNHPRADAERVHPPR